MNKILKLLVLFSLIALPLSGCIDKVTMDQNGTVTIDSVKSTTGTVNVQNNDDIVQDVPVENTSEVAEVNKTEESGKIAASDYKESEDDEINAPEQDNTADSPIAEIPENTTPVNKNIENITEVGAEGVTANEDTGIDAEVTAEVVTDNVTEGNIIEETSEIENIISDDSKMN